MKKNTSLYILLLFLIIVNGFFLYNYLGKDDVKKGGRQGNPMGFIVKQLDFNDEQMELVDDLNKKHHHKMMRFSNETRLLKDALFAKISDVSITETYVDSITNLIGEKQAELDREAFHHFKVIEEMCNDKQKEKFKSIIKDAIGKGARKNRPPRKEGEGHRPPLKHGEHNGPPPMRGEHNGPPPKNN